VDRAVSAAGRGRFEPTVLGRPFGLEGDRGGRGGRGRGRGDGGRGGSPGARVRVFDSPDAPADARGLERVRRGAAGIDLAAPPVVLPDFHHKASMEMPSSLAVATLDTVRPTFTSA
jgi:hypothetical protein